jgi:protease-4
LQKLYSILDLHAEVFKQGPLADWQYEHQPLSALAKQRIHEALEGNYNAFIERVAAGRKMTPTRARELGEGRVYTGKQALALGLVDKVGNLSDAITEARHQAGIADDAEVEITVPNEEFKLFDLRHMFFQSQVPDLTSIWRDKIDHLQHMQNKAWALMPLRAAID